MPAIMSGNMINVGPGDPAFNVMSNLCDYFEIGEKGGADVWLEGQIVSGEFVFNGRIILKDGSHGTVIDNFPKGPTPKGWNQRRNLDVEGYELFDNRGELVFSYTIEDRICSVQMNLYKLRPCGRI